MSSNSVALLCVLKLDGSRYAYYFHVLHKQGICMYSGTKPRYKNQTSKINLAQLVLPEAQHNSV